MSTKRIVILGASGFIGSHLISLLESEVCEVEGLSSSGIDLLQPQSVSALQSTLRDGDIVVHSAAIAPARNAAEAAANLTMTHHLVTASTGIKLRQVVVVSSDAVYGSASGVVSEQTDCKPDSLHGVMSLGRELSCASINTEVLTIVRSAPVYGVGDTHNSYGPNRFAQQAIAGEQITIFGAGEAGRDHVSVTDVAKVTVRSIFQGEEGVINVASGQMCTFQEIAELVSEATPSEAPIQSIGTESEPTFRAFDLSGLVRRFPDHTPTKPKSGIPEMIRSLVRAS